MACANSLSTPPVRPPTYRTDRLHTMEELLHYTWQHRLFPLTPLRTTTGQLVEVIDSGLHNSDSGPDFFNAKVRIDGQLWVGNVELHLRSSDWYKHHHEADAHYNNVVLHVVELADCEVCTAAGTTLPQIELTVPQHVRRNFDTLMTAAAYPPCYEVLPQLPQLHVHHWLSALSVERLEAKTARLNAWLAQTAGDWERVLFVALARGFGFGKNTDAFERWALTIEPQHIGKHRDNAFQVEAFFFGQAGLLDEAAVKPEHRDNHFWALQQEYHFLQRKFQLVPLPYAQWKFLRLRPHNFPHIRLAQLAQLYTAQRLSLSQLRAAASLHDLRQLLRASTSNYWTAHYAFGRSFGRERPSLSLSTSSLNLLLINVVVPLLFAYAQHHHDEALQERALALLEALPAEHNGIVRTWHEVGLSAEHAADSQALLQLKLHYCDRKDCLRCRFGAFYLRHSDAPTAAPSAE